MPSEQSLSTKFPYLKARKYLHITDQWVNIAPDVLQDLILHSKGAVISTLDSLPVVNGAISVPRSSVIEFSLGPGFLFDLGFLCLLLRTVFI